MDSYSIKIKDKKIDAFNITLSQAVFPKEESTIYINTILYIQQDKDSLLNELIDRNIDWITSAFKEQNFKFVHLQNIIRTWANDFNFFKEIIKYEFPFYNDSQLSELHIYLKTHLENNFIDLRIDYSILINETIVTPHNLFTGLLTISDVDSSLIVLPSITNDLELKDFFHGYSNLLNRKKITSDLSNTINDKPNLSLFDPSCYSEDFADSNFDTLAIAKDIEDKISILKHAGYNKLVFEIIERSLKNDGKSIPSKLGQTTNKEIQLSRISIDESFRIFLPAYNNIEISLTPLPKAIYLLFLKHPNGIIFKHLSSHKQELFDIYNKIAYRETSEEKRKSINELTNPISNSINEKVARIKGAFLKSIDDRFAKYYYITGERGKEMKILKASSFDKDTNLKIVDTDLLF